MRRSQAFHLRLKPAALAVLAALAAPAALAQERELAAVTVSEQAYSDTTEVVSARELDARAARDTRDIFQNETGVSVGGGGNAIAQKIYVRNIEDTLLTVTLDGAPQGGNVFHHQGRILINPDMLKQVEIDKGGTVASVGPGGLAGSVRMTTKDARDLLRDGQRLGGLVEGGLSSNAGNRIGGAVYGLAGEAFDFLLYANRSKTEDYEDGDGHEQKHSGSTQKSGLFKANWALAAGHTLYFGYQALEDEGTRFLRPHMVAIPGNVEPVPQRLEQRTVTAGYRYSGEGFVRKADLGVFVDDMENRRTNASAAFTKPAGYRYGEALTSTGVNVLLESRLGDSTLRYGLNHHERRAEALNPTKKGVAGNATDEDSTVTGVFAESAIPLGSVFVLDLGARYDWYSYDDNHGQNFKSDGFSPNAALTLQATDTLSVRLGGSRTVRGAGLKEAFMLDNGPGPFIYRNEKDLKAETADNFELSATYDDGSFSLRGAVFRMTIDDYIGMVFQGATAANPASRRNLGKVESRGYELGAGWRAGHFRTGLSMSYARPELNGHDLSDGDFSLGVTTGRSWLFNASYALPAWNLELSWNSRAVEALKYRPAGGAKETKDGYAVHDLHATWYPRGKDDLRLTFSVRNLFDRFYYDQTTYGYGTTQGMFLGYPEPGRDVRLDLSWKF